MPTGRADLSAMLRALILIAPGALLVALPTPGAEADVGSLLVSRPLAVNSTPPPALASGAGRVYLADLDRRSLAAAVEQKEALSLELLPGVEVASVEWDSEEHESGFRVWQGTVVEEPRSEVTLVFDGETLAGSLWSSHGEFRLLSDGRDRVWVAEIASNADQSRRVVAVPRGRIGAEYSLRRVGAAAKRARRDGIAPIEILFAYTPAARREAGGASRLRALLLLDVADLDRAFRRSGVKMRARMAAAVEADYVEFENDDPLEGYFRDYVRNFEFDDGYLDEVHLHRRDHRGDFVVLVTASRPTYCGLSTFWPQVIPMRARWAFSVVGARCVGGGLTIPTLVGYNMGLWVQRVGRNNRFQPRRRYARAYVEPSGLFRTIMALRCEGCGPKIARFSNPAVTYRGKPIGIGWKRPDSAHNVRSLNRTRWILAGYSEHACTVDPGPRCARR